jgi:hypothetical protein
MAIGELQTWVMRELATKQGLIEGLPSRPGTNPDEMEQAIDGLLRRQYVRVIGPPNANSYFGRDVDELRLLPSGVNFLRSLK